MLFGLSGRALNINTSEQESQMLNSTVWAHVAFEILEMPTNQRIHLIHSTASRKINHARSRSSSVRPRAKVPSLIFVQSGEFLWCTQNQPPPMLRLNWQLTSELGQL